jgi:hypothetical protein
MHPHTNCVDRLGRQEGGQQAREPRFEQNRSADGGGTLPAAELKRRRRNDVSDSGIQAPAAK